VLALPAVREVFLGTEVTAELRDTGTTAASVRAIATDQESL
jgi:hypothetical protein